MMRPPGNLRSNRATVSICSSHGANQASIFGARGSIRCSIRIFIEDEFLNVVPSTARPNSRSEISQRTLLSSLDGAWPHPPEKGQRVIRSHTLAPDQVCSHHAHGPPPPCLTVDEQRPARVQLIVHPLGGGQQALEFWRLVVLHGDMHVVHRPVEPGGGERVFGDRQYAVDALASKPFHLPS